MFPCGAPESCRCRLVPHRALASSTVVLILIPLLSGCFGPPSDIERTPTDLPNWDNGNWWQYNISGSLPAPWMETRLGEVGGARDSGHAINFSIDEDATFVAWPDEATVLTDSDQASMLARFGLPFATDWEVPLGVTRGSIHERYNIAEQVIRGSQFFSWPLTDGKVWTTRFMNTTLTVTSQSSVDDRFIIEARHEGDLLLQYEYSEEVRWFTEFVVLDGVGNVRLEASLLDHGLSGWNGTLYRISDGSATSACWGGRGSAPASPGACPIQSVTAVPGGSSAFYYNLAYLSTGPGAITVARDDPGEAAPRLWHSDVCPCRVDQYIVEHVDATGTYAWSLDNAFSGDERWVFFWIFYGCKNVYVLDEGRFDVSDLCSTSR